MMNVAKWGNSLAVRLPAELVRELGLKEGDEVAIIGATREGVMRTHMIVQNNYRRDSVYFSIIDSEWPKVKKRLEALTASAGKRTR